MSAPAILVIGNTGQLATALAEQAGDRNLICLGRPEVDFAQPVSLAAAMARVRPRLVINAAAYTAVDKAETDAEAAQQANATGPAELARLCALADIPLIHVSTDYVFDGSKGAPYLETDPANPIGVYGASKRAGEVAVLAACPKALVLRTSWVYGPYGKNFVLTMLNAAARLPQLRVVADQIGCPTSAPDLATAILAVVDRVLAGWQADYAGLYHAAGTGWTSWHGLAEFAVAEAARHGRPQPPIAALATADWPTPVRRPADSRLDCSRLQHVFGVTLPHWQDAVRRTVARVMEDARQQAC